MELHWQKDPNSFDWVGRDRYGDVYAIVKDNSPKTYQQFAIVGMNHTLYYWNTFSDKKFDSRKEAMIDAETRLKEKETK